MASGLQKKYIQNSNEEYKGNESQSISVLPMLDLIIFLLTRLFSFRYCHLLLLLTLFYGGHLLAEVASSFGVRSVAFVEK